MVIARNNTRRSVTHVALLFSQFTVHHIDSASFGRRCTDSVCRTMVTIHDRRVAVHLPTVQVVEGSESVNLFAAVDGIIRAV